ncbi:MAG: peptide deformylase [Rhodospirillales bacterium]|jgi:peptide deformylase|nr:peptide deformylase [Rhodospirillales bacterium]MBT4006968.1 peptide deformylase [Rhodospirillales bacterium]MBT5075952.1 peptide deformylase [Rhodospirillales bacterium]MBT5113005.1 peptide deformylase [Rhodospirillales bacterium]MBT5672881.1 peptide deformylase [Rhodospirillales bacterium]
MAILPIITAPDPRLKIKATPVDRVDDDVRQLMDDMLETMYVAPGIGLAAPQVGSKLRVIVLDVGEEVPEGHPKNSQSKKRNPMQLANPEILWASEETLIAEEGCLSLPDHYADVKRPASVRLRYLDYENEVREIEASDTLGICLQHEIDHLDGRLFIDHISALRRSMVLRKLKKAKKAEKSEKASIY